MDDLDANVQECAVDDDLALETLVDQGLLQVVATPFGGLVEQGGADGMTTKDASSERRAFSRTWQRRNSWRRRSSPPLRHSVT